MITFDHAGIVRSQRGCWSFGVHEVSMPTFYHFEFIVSMKTFDYAGIVRSQRGGWSFGVHLVAMRTSGNIELMQSQ